jgi:hypothetical protein
MTAQLETIVTTLMIHMEQQITQLLSRPLALQATTAQREQAIPKLTHASLEPTSQEQEPPLHLTVPIAMPATIALTTE